MTIIFNLTSEAKVIGDVSKYNYRNLVSYSGKIENTSNVHADKLTLKGEICPGKVVEFRVDAIDKVEFQEFNKTSELITFSLNRLSKKNKCFFDILVERVGEKAEKFHISWGKEGFINIVPKNADEGTVRAIKRGIDLSLKERHKWLKNNTKTISKRRK